MTPICRVGETLEGGKMVPENSVICVACKNHGVVRHLTPKEIEGCQRLGIPPHCTAHVRSFIAERIRDEEDAKKHAATKWNQERVVENKARKKEIKKDDELLLAEVAKELGVKRWFLEGQIIAKGLLPYRKLEEARERIVVKRADLERLIEAAVDGEKWVPDLVRELIRLGPAHK
jgi:hypothetical protein